MWYEAGVLSALSVGAVLLYAGFWMSTGALVRIVGRGAPADEGARPGSRSARRTAALVGLCLALCLTLLGALTLYVAAAHLVG